MVLRDLYIQKQPQEFYKKVVLKNFAIFTEKRLCWSLFLIKLQAWRSATLLKRDSKTCKRTLYFLLAFFLVLNVRFKVRLTYPSQKSCFLCFNENSLKLMKNAFSFILEPLFVLKVFRFLSWLFKKKKKRVD